MMRNTFFKLALMGSLLMSFGACEDYMNNETNLISEDNLSEIEKRPLRLRQDGFSSQVWDSIHVLVDQQYAYDMANLDPSWTEEQKTEYLESEYSRKGKLLKDAMSLLKANYQAGGKDSLTTEQLKDKLLDALAPWKESPYAQEFGDHLQKLPKK